MSHDDFAFEPVNGLPESLPEGEEILWQGRPDGLRLAREALNLVPVLGYFALLALWRAITLIDTGGPGQALAGAIPYLAMGAVAGGILLLIGVVQARSTVYTVTNRRVTMRVGAALTVTFNLPFSRIASAGLDLRKGGTGTIAMTLTPGTRLSYLVLWPHVRPWRMKRTEPALRCIPRAAEVAALLAGAMEEAAAEPVVARRPDPAALAAE